MVSDVPFASEDLADLACHLEDEAGHGIDNKAAGRLLASVEHVERLFTDEQWRERISNASLAIGALPIHQLVARGRKQTAKELRGKR